MRFFNLLVFGIAVSCFANTTTLMAKPYQLEGESIEAKIANAIHQFKKHRIKRASDKVILLGPERDSFTGKAKTLNRFLMEMAKFSNSKKVTVSFTGPAGTNSFEPLTSSAAQVSVDFDWEVHRSQEYIQVIIPLAARIPFQSIQVPDQIKVFATHGAPKVAEVFAKLHNAGK